MAFAHARVAADRRSMAMYRVYLVSQGAHAGGSRQMGLETFFPPRVLREQAEVHDPQLQTRCRFGCSSPVTRNFKS